MLNLTIHLKDNEAIVVSFLDLSNDSVDDVYNGLANYLRTRNIRSKLVFDRDYLVNREFNKLVKDCEI